MIFRVAECGRWTAFLSPSAYYSHTGMMPVDGDGEHIVSIYFEYHRELDNDLPSPQSMIGWDVDGMWKSAIEYIEERHAEDMQETK